MDLKDLKKMYSSFEKKYSLPSFKKLNEDFEIDKISQESDCFLRIVRKVIMEKVVNSLNFLEMLMNPVNAPRVYFPYIRSMTEGDREIIERIYRNLADLSLVSLELEFGYNEKKEAEIIKKSYKEWNSLKPDFTKILSNIRNPNTPVKKERNYFG